MPSPTDKKPATPQAYTATITAFIIWGLAALFWDLLSHIETGKVFTHRVLWSFIILSACLNKKIPCLLIQLIKQPKELLLSLASGACIGINWYVFIYGVSQHRLLEVSLGYFLSPLCNVIAGIIVFGERSSRLQYFLFAMIFLAIALESILTGSFGWIAIVLAVTFCLYGVTKKLRVTTGFTSLYIETAVILPVVLCFGTIEMSEFSEGLSTNLILLVIGGAMTLAPLGLFSYGAKYLELKVVGLIQYLAPSLQFLVGVFYFHETIPTPKLMSFSVVWFAIIVLLAERWSYKKRIH